ncbi:hypothetical protein [Kitasatospora xanthocidica]|uniref:hypothetical protein n=1 Tax=Kitasatospora xanthocidica TaxID=83382 RepID=UPI00167B36D5|nr:hypothetical protein [Kitasatospora xanthocidica]
MTQAHIDQLRQSGSETGHVEFAERMVRALTDDLAALDALPRDDGFWRGWANDRATIGKLRDYATGRLDRDPSDRVARWALVALALGGGANDGGLSLLGPEIGADPTVVADAVVIADWVVRQIGLDATPELREACGHADRRTLEALARTDGGQAASIALRVLDGNPFAGA